MERDSEGERTPSEESVENWAGRMWKIWQSINRSRARRGAKVYVPGPPKYDEEGNRIIMELTSKEPGQQDEDPLGRRRS